MVNITFITGNQNKADKLAEYLGLPVKHQKVELDEIQTLDIHKIVEHKVKQAYEQLKSPVLVEDSSLEFEALNGLPGPFIKFFVDNIPYEDICSLLDGKSRKATARTVFGYYDGNEVKFIESELHGTIAEKPVKGDNGYDWDHFFISEGDTVTRSCLTNEEYQKSYLESKPLEQLKQFLININ